MMEFRDQFRHEYHAGRYYFKAPPVSTARWSEIDWIDYIASNGWFMSQRDAVEEFDDHEAERGYN